MKKEKIDWRIESTGRTEKRWSGKSPLRKCHVNRDLFVGGNSVSRIPDRRKNNYKSPEAGTCLFVFEEELKGVPGAG